MLGVDDIRQRREEIIDVATRHGASHIRIFGSVARGDATTNSAVDLVARFDPDRSLFDHGGLIDNVENLLGIKVDVVNDEVMRDRFRELVLKEAMAI